MPKVSRSTASETIAIDGLDVRFEHLDGGYSVCFESHTADAELAELFRGLPEDRCQLPTARRPTRPGTPTTCRPVIRRSTTPERRSWSSAQRTSWARRWAW